MASNMLLNALENLVGNKCDNEEILRTMSDFNDYAQGRYSDKDLVNYDEACDILGYTRTNRIGLKRVLDKNGIKQVKMNNLSVGFPKHKVEALLHKKE
jgi:hypothetical protein